MKVVQKMLHDGFDPDEYSRISHTICLADFNTNYPNPNRINRIASEINEYVKTKNRDAKGVK